MIKTTTHTPCIFGVRVVWLFKSVIRGLPERILNQIWINIQFCLMNRNPIILFRELTFLIRCSYKIAIGVAYIITILRTEEIHSIKFLMLYHLLTYHQLFYVLYCPCHVLYQQSNAQHIILHLYDSFFL